MRYKLASITQRIRVPAICALCNQFHKGLFAVCDYCLQWIPRLGLSCQQCAIPLPDTRYLLCGHCIKNPPHFDRTYIACPFEEPLRSLLHQFKYQNGLYLTPVLTHLMQQALPNTDAQCLIPVPMHPKRLKQRGFNQAAVLAKHLAQKTGIPYQVNTCTKIKNTSPQASLDSQKRAKNLHNVFSAKEMPFDHVLIIDDLLTTGATANELARTLKNAGVGQVDVWCGARTLLERLGPV